MILNPEPQDVSALPPVVFDAAIDAAEGENANTPSSQQQASSAQRARREGSGLNGDSTQQKFVLDKAYALVMFVVVYMVLFGATVFVLRTLWRHGLCGGGLRSPRTPETPPKVSLFSVQPLDFSSATAPHMCTL